MQRSIAFSHLGSRRHLLLWITPSDTIARLSRYRQQPVAPTRAANARLIELHDFGSNPGSLRGFLHVPKRQRKNTALVVVLHGCRQTAAAYDHGSGWSDLADREGFVVLFPEQQRQNNANLCFNWFNSSDIARGSGEALSIFQMVDAVQRKLSVDPSKVFVTGLSAGGAMANVMLATYPEVFAGGAIIAGLPYGSARTIPEAFDRMRGHGGPSHAALTEFVRKASNHRGPWPTVSGWQGDADGTVSPSNAQAIAAQWRGLHGVEDFPAETVMANGDAGSAFDLATPAGSDSWSSTSALSPASAASATNFSNIFFIAHPTANATDAVTTARPAVSFDDRITDFARGGYHGCLEHLLPTIKC